MEKKFQLSIDDIYNRRFVKDVKGYNPDEVDAFLDQVIKDYDAYDKALAEQNRLIVQLNGEVSSKTNDVSKLIKKCQGADEEIKRLEVDNASLSNRLSGIKPGDSVNKENMEYIQKIHDYEDFIFKMGYNPTSLKKRND